MIRERERRGAGERGREGYSWQAALLAEADGNDALIGTECEAFETWEGQAVATLLITHTRVRECIHRHTHGPPTSKGLPSLDPLLLHANTSKLPDTHKRCLAQTHDTHRELLTCCTATLGLKLPNSQSDTGTLIKTYAIVLHTASLCLKFHHDVLTLTNGIHKFGCFSPS